MCNGKIYKILIFTKNKIDLIFKLLVSYSLFNIINWLYHINRARIWSLRSGRIIKTRKYEFILIVL